MPRRKIDRSGPETGGFLNLKTGERDGREALPRVCERIRYYREKRGMEQKELTRLLGGSKNLVSNWENGRSRPDINQLPALAGALGVSLHALLGLEEEGDGMSAAEKKLLSVYRSLSPGHRHVVDRLADSLAVVERSAAVPDLRRLILFDKPLAAGVGDPAEFEDGGEPFYIYASVDCGHADYVFRVNGESMEPEYRDGDMVYVRRLEGGDALGRGEVGAFMLGNETYIKVLGDEGLLSLNPAFPPIRVEEEESAYLIGRVTGKVRRRELPSPDEVALYTASAGGEGEE